MGNSYKNTGSFTALNTPATTPAAGSVIPGATPKYAKQAERTDGYKDTMARMYLYFKDPASSQNLTAYFRGLGDARLNNLKDKVVGTAPAPGGTAGASLGYIEFLLQTASHKYDEKIDVIETLADKYVAYAYGSSHPVFFYQIAMLNNKQDDQAANMYRLYWHVLRATRLANTQAEVYFEYDRMIVCGAMRAFSWSLQATDESYCQGSFEILVRRVLLLPEDTAKSMYDNAAASLTTAASVTGTNLGQVQATANSVLTITP